MITEIVNIHQPKIHIAPDMPIKLINKYTYELYGKWENGLHLLIDTNSVSVISMCVLINNGKVVTVYKQNK